MDWNLDKVYPFRENLNRIQGSEAEGDNWDIA